MPLRQETAGRGVMRWLPGLRTLRDYQPAWLRHDIVAGLVLTTMLVPVGIAYAVASGVPGIYGLYATIVPLLAYALFGPSRILVLGPDSSLAAVILGSCCRCPAAIPTRAIALASMMAIVSGAGLHPGRRGCGSGFITELLSKPIRYGYMNGIALTVLISQLPKLFGFSIESDGPLREPVGDRRGGPGRQDQLGGVRRGRRHAGGDPAAQGQQARAGHPDRRGRRDRRRRRASTWRRERACRCWARCRRACPHSRFPWISLGRHRPGADRRLRRRHGVLRRHQRPVARLCRADRHRVDPNQEMVGLGAANLAAGFFQGFPISSSSSRTPVAEAAGAKTQLTGVVGALAVAAAAASRRRTCCSTCPTPRWPPSSSPRPSACSSSPTSRRIYRIQRWEFWLSIVCFVGVAVFGAIPGIGLAIVDRRHRVPVGRLAAALRRPGPRRRRQGYHDITRYPDARLIPGLVLFRWDAPLFFANAELFKERVLDAVAASPTPVRRVVVAAEPVTSVDVTAADALAELDETLQAAGIELCFAELKDPVKDKLKRFGLFGRFGDEVFFPTIGAAVSAISRPTMVDWDDPRKKLAAAIARMARRI